MRRLARSWFRQPPVTINRLRSPACLPRATQGRRGFLLVEALLTIVVIAIGLVLISQSLAGNLKAVSRIQQYHRLLRLAQSTLDQLEAEAQQFRGLARHAGVFDAPDNQYRWNVTIDPVQSRDIPDEILPSVLAVTLTVTRSDIAAPFVRLNTVWPADWLAE